MSADMSAETLDIWNPFTYCRYMRKNTEWEVVSVTDLWPGDRVWVQDQSARVDQVVPGLTTYRVELNDGRTLVADVEANFYRAEES